MTLKKPLRRRAIIIYTTSRYVGLGILLLRGIVFAKYLGPTLFGVWGFLSLLSQYLAYSNLGIQHSTTVELSNKETVETEENLQLIANALGFSFLLLLVLTLSGLAIQSTDLTLFGQYDVNRYMLLLGLIAGLTHVTTLMISIYRAYGAIYRIAIFQLIDAIMPLTVLWLAKGESLISLLLLSIVVSQMIGIVIFFTKTPWRLSVKFSRSIVARLIVISLPLLIYNASFNMITMIGRTILSGFYSVEVMGYYTFANSITNAVFLGLRSVAFILLPDVIYKTRSGLSNAHALALADKSNNLFGTSAYLLTFALILTLPILFLYIPEYRPAKQTISILVLAQAMLSASFGYNAVALARSNQLQVAKLSVFAVALVSLFSLLFVSVGMDFLSIAIAVWIGATVFSFLQGQLSLQLLDGYKAPADLLKNRLLVGGLVSTALFLLLSYLGYEFAANTLSPLIFVAINRSNLAALARIGYSYIAR